MEKGKKICTKVKLTDYVVEFLQEKGIHDFLDTREP